MLEQQEPGRPGCRWSIRNTRLHVELQHTFCSLEKTFGTDAFGVCFAATAGRADATTTTAIVDSVLTVARD